MSWAKSELASICDVFADGDWIETKDQSENGIRLIQTGNVGFGKFKLRDSKARYISEETFKRLRCTEIKQGDILISRLPDPVGRACVIPELNVKSITAVDCTIIRTNKKIINTEYLNYFCQSYEYFEQIKKNITGATRQRISRNLLGKIEVPIPPLPIQQKIVEKLDAIFAEIDKAAVSVEENVKNAEALFKSYLSEVFKRGGEDWKLSTLGEYYDVRDGTHDSPKFQDFGYPLVTSKNLKDGNITFEKIKYISKDDFLNISQRSGVKKNDVLMAMIGTIGNPVVVDTDDEFAIKNVALFKTNNSQSSKFLSYYLSSDYVIKKMEKDCKGTTQKFVGLGYLRSFPIKIPNKNTQEKVVQTLSENEKYIKILLKSYVQKLNEILYLKNSILKQAFNG